MLSCIIQVTQYDQEGPHKRKEVSHRAGGKQTEADLECCKERDSARVSRGTSLLTLTGPVTILDAGLQNCKKIHSCCFKPPTSVVVCYRNLIWGKSSSPIRRAGVPFPLCYPPLGPGQGCCHGRI